MKLSRIGARDHQVRRMHGLVQHLGIGQHQAVWAAFEQSDAVIAVVGDDQVVVAVIVVVSHDPGDRVRRRRSE